MGLPGGSVVKNPPANTGDEFNREDPLEKKTATHSWLGEPTHRGNWQTAVRGAAEESDVT